MSRFLIKEINCCYECPKYSDKKKKQCLLTKRVFGAGDSCPPDWCPLPKELNARI